MRLLAVLMIIAGLAIGYGAILEVNAYGPAELPFWVGVLAAGAGLFFAAAGVLLLIQRRAARGVVLSAALLMGVVTAVGTFTLVMGPPATLVGALSALAALCWFWRTREGDVRTA